MSSSIDDVDAEGAAKLRRSERRTQIVVMITAGMMVTELVVGAWTGSLALTADGWHMATHAGALGVAAFSYWFARTRAGDPKFTFGTGKVYALGGYSSAILLILVAVWMVFEAIQRLFRPAPIQFMDALPVAVLGLIVNVACVFLLDPDHDSLGEPDDGDEHHHHHHDHNLRSAYFHVAADAVTSILAIAALLAGHFFGLVFLDPLMAIVGCIVSIRWGAGLFQRSSYQLLDQRAAPGVAKKIEGVIEGFEDTRIRALHLWELGPGRLGCIMSLISQSSRRSREYRSAILDAVKLAHLTIEVERPASVPPPPNDTPTFDSEVVLSMSPRALEADHEVAPSAPRAPIETP